MTLKFSSLGDSLRTTALEQESYKIKKRPGKYVNAYLNVRRWLPYQIVLVRVGLTRIWDHPFCSHFCFASKKPLPSVVELLAGGVAVKKEESAEG